MADEPHLRLKLLGNPRLVRDDRPVTGFASGKVQALLFYLAVTARPHSREALVGLLWGDMPEADARTNLRQALSNLRKVVPDHVTIERDAVAFNRDSAYWLDVAEFEMAAEHRRSTSDDAPVVDRLQSAVDLYEGDFLEGFSVRDAPDFEEWALAQRERLRELALGALHALTNDYLRRGQYAQGIDSARRVLSLDPWREEAHRQLMLLLARSGQHSAALAQYEACRRVLAQELGVEPSAETAALAERIRAARSGPRHNLPPQVTPFVGRQTELADVVGRLNDPACRLLTLVGPGGIGKTRLAIEAAGRCVDAFINGVRFVSLAAVTSADALVSAIAGALSMAFHDRADPRSQLTDYLRQKELLLVLDNFEQLLDATDLIGDMLRGAPDVTVLVTARKRLNLRGEWAVEVGGLRVPGLAWPEAMERYSAVQLFDQSARRVRAGFALSPEEAPAVVRICQLVEGLPLGIELAAAWTRALDCGSIAREIERSVDFLATTERDVPERHRSLHAVFDHSWQGLSAQEQAVFGCLSVFRGGFEREAAEQVADASPLILSALVDKSLLRLHPSGRYGIHELLRQYAADKLAASPDEGRAARTRHSRCYAAFMHLRESLLKGSNPRRALDEIRPEIENVRAGWRWASVAAPDAPLVADIALCAESLMVYWEMHASYVEGEREFVEAAKAFGDPVDALDRLDRQSCLLLADLLSPQGWFCFRLGRFVEGRARVEVGLKLLRHFDATAQMGYPLLFAAACEFGMGNLAEARRLFLESGEAYRAVEDWWGVGGALGNAGQVALAMGDYAEAGRCLSESLEILKRHDIRFLLVNTLSNLCGLKLALGERDEARRIMLESLDVSREMEDAYSIATALNGLGAIALAAADYAEARAHCEEALSILTEIGDRWSQASTLNHLGEAALGQGRLKEARRHFLQGLATAQDINAVSVALNSLHGLAALLLEEGEAERALELAVFVLHQPGSEQEAKDRARQIVERASAALPPEASAAARANAQSRSLQEVVTVLLGEV